MTNPYHLYVPDSDPPPQNVSDQMRAYAEAALGMPIVFAGDGDPNKPMLKVTIALAILIPPGEESKAQGYAQDCDSILQDMGKSVVSPDTAVLKIEPATPEEVRDYDRTRED